MFKVQLWRISFIGFAMHLFGSGFLAWAGLECPESEIKTLLERTRDVQKNNCLPETNVADLTQAAKDLSHESSCDGPELSNIRQLLVDLKISLALDGESKNCKPELAKVTALLEILRSKNKSKRLKK